jgi:hypothetical protein
MDRRFRIDIDGLCRSTAFAAPAMVARGMWERVCACHDRSVVKLSSAGGATSERSEAVGCSRVGVHWCEPASGTPLATYPRGSMSWAVRHAS